jgi:hypothetical protein
VLLYLFTAPAPVSCSNLIVQTIFLIIAGLVLLVIVMIGAIVSG